MDIRSFYCTYKLYIPHDPAQPHARHGRATRRPHLTLTRLRRVSGAAAVRAHIPISIFQSHIFDDGKLMIEITCRVSGSAPA